MAKSMTGYGRAQQTLHGRDISVELRSVNHRFFEYSARVPRAYGYLEEKLKSYLQGSVSRGKIDVGVQIITVDGASEDVAINQTLAGEYLRALRELGDELEIRDDITLSSISRFSDIFVVRRTDGDENEIWQDVRAVADEALARFISMRETEGARLAEDMLARCAAIERCVALVEERSPQTLAEYRERLFSRMQELLGGTAVDEARLLQEVAIMGDKLAVDEETVRLHSHIAQFRAILAGDEPSGRKLDFLIQEFNREANTIGSKAQDADIARVVVDIKSEIEKIREQVQNLE